MIDPYSLVFILALVFSSFQIKQILSGKLFPMKALGYYAVVSGTGELPISVMLEIPASVYTSRHT